MPESQMISIDINSIHINKSELAQRLKTPVSFEHELLSRCEEKLVNICKPKGCIIETPIKTEAPDVVFLGDNKIISKDLYKNLCGCTRAYIMAVTLGMEVDRKIMSLSVVSPAEGFIFDAVASAYADALADYVSEILKSKGKLRPRYSPGYGDLSLDIQKDVLDVLNADKLIGIKLGANLLMTPKKSITAIQGVEQ